MNKEIEEALRVGDDRKVEEYIKQLEFNLKAAEKEHEHDLAMIDEVKGNAVKLYKKNRELKEILDKVTDKLNEEIETYKNSKELTQKEQIELDHAQEILNIIEGEIKYDKRNKSYN